MTQTPSASPAPDFQSIPFAPDQPAAARRSRLFYFGLAGVIAGGICCVLSVVALVLYGVLGRNAAPAATVLPVITPPGTALPAETAPPSSTATNTTIPASTEAVPTQKTGGNATGFSDDFSNNNSGWKTFSTDYSEAIYNSSGFFEMGVKQANSYLVSLPPDNLARPIKNILIGVRAQPAQFNTGQYGVVCRYQDNDNFYLAGISEKRFYIGKLVKGEWTYLTSPGWQTLPSTTSDADGYQVIKMSCIDGFIVLEVNGIGAAHVTDEEFTTGDAGLCVWAGDTVDKVGYYARAGFDDFSLSLP